MGGTPSATNERVRPWHFSVATRGAGRLGNGTGAPCERSVIVAGVRVPCCLGDGGKTKSVCDGPDVSGGSTERCGGNIVFESERTTSGGGVGLPDWVRTRRGSSMTAGPGVDTDGSGIAEGTGAGMGAGALAMGAADCGADDPGVGDAGTGGRRLTKGAGRRLGLDALRGGMSNDDLTAVRGGGGMLNVVFVAGADGGGRGV